MILSTNKYLRSMTPHNRNFILDTILMVSCQLWEFDIWLYIFKQLYAQCGYIGILNHLIKATISVPTIQFRDIIHVYSVGVYYKCMIWLLSNLNHATSIFFIQGEDNYFKLNWIILQQITTKKYKYSLTILWS